jgi:arylamine N-acetyltransferase
VTSRSGAVRPDPAADIDGYLARLGLERPARPNLDWLFEAHRAHVEKIPYENLEIQLGRATTVDPAEAIGRIARGRGGYCFHLNGALGTLLASLGYEVTRHLGDVRGPSSDQASTDLTINHQVLTVACEGEYWFVDTGLGDAPYEPMPLRAGTVTQGPFTYGLEPWAGRPGGWRFVHDPRQESFASMVFAPEPVEVDAFAAAHLRLSTSPESDFVRAAVAGRRHARGADVLRGRVFYRIDSAGVTRELIDSQGAWYELLADVFGLRLPDVDAAERAKLWERIAVAHERWLVDRAAAG